MLDSIFGDPDWPWSVWAHTQILDTASAALDALRRGGPFTLDDLEAAGSRYGGATPDGDEQERMRFVLESTIQRLPGQLGALISTAYDEALLRLTQTSFGDIPY